jgi:protein-S-isoprenylcysteine O-methyltransferase Ste14
MPDDEQDKAGVVAPPPLIYLVALVFGLLLNRRRPAGIAALRNALWAIVLLPVALLVIQRGVIEREERYLERKFGEEYLSYKARVRRWI